MSDDIILNKEDSINLVHNLLHPNKEALAKRDAFLADVDDMEMFTQYEYKLDIVYGCARNQKGIQFPVHRIVYTYSTEDEIDNVIK